MSTFVFIFYFFFQKVLFLFLKFFLLFNTKKTIAYTMVFSLYMMRYDHYREKRYFSLISKTIKLVYLSEKTPFVYGKDEA